ncbi:endonuclease domain of the non-LTR retrotransposon LINE-1 [Elysia marginata]|uniref:Endonuclease domain of the non-LTR retrotransposon LINE-1 n=1 Tax=Elysia marginata TaxID=1093978 RepID=A0AAV4FNA4_9GAST|nr:endonuclease domain of the non-LTR retrotransposon LINE-1 [Elysia marginata]
MLLDNELDYISGAPHHSRETEKFNMFLHTWNLHDCWRTRNANKKDFTWSKDKPFIARRLDYIFCSGDLISDVADTDIVHFPSTDHRAVVTQFVEHPFPRGPSRWQFNASLLKSKDFVKHMNIFIPNFLEDPQNVDIDCRTKWELLKAGIRLECMYFSRCTFNKKGNE